jgi:hypothetical protein
MPSTGFGLSIPERKRLQTNALKKAGTGIGVHSMYW